MPQECTICRHPKRKAIDLALVRHAASFRVMAGQFDVAPTTLQRHEAHVSQALIKQHAEKQEKAARSSYDYFTNGIREAEDLLREGKEESLQLAISALGELRQWVTQWAKLVGDIKEGATVNVLVASPEWVEMKGKIVAALLPYPEAAAAVSEAIEPKASA
jgi:hypothetical protein